MMSSFIAPLQHFCPVFHREEELYFRRSELHHRRAPPFPSPAHRVPLITPSINLHYASLRNPPPTREVKERKKKEDNFKQEGAGACLKEKRERGGGAKACLPAFAMERRRPANCLRFLRRFSRTILSLPAALIDKQRSIFLCMSVEVYPLPLPTILDTKKRAGKKKSPASSRLPKL